MISNSDQESENEDCEIHISETKDAYKDLHTLQEKEKNVYTFLESDLKDQGSLKIEDLKRQVLPLSYEKCDKNALEMEKKELTTSLIEAKNWAKEFCRDQRSRLKIIKRKLHAELKRNMVLQVDLIKARLEEEKTLKQQGNHIYLLQSSLHQTPQRYMLDQVQNKTQRKKETSYFINKRIQLEQVESIQPTLPTEERDPRMLGSNFNQ